MIDINNSIRVKIKTLVVLVFVQAVSFSVGMYSAKTLWQPQQNYSNYNTLNTKHNNPPITEQSEPLSLNLTKQNTPENCIIKGNISNGRKIYHIKGGAFYERTSAEMCFITESQALENGFTKSTR